jgi:ABC-type transport system involved in multi-copper enzyme maturation permease subunit
MNALVKKEIRLLLPGFLIGCGLAFSSGFWREGDDPLSGFLMMLPFVVCPAVAVMIALNSFGGEVGSGTFAMLLAQPVSRQKIWQIKILLLSLALLIVGGLWIGSFCLRVDFFHSSRSWENVYDSFEDATMFALVVFSGGLWTVLLLRQVAAAFWFTLLVPGVIWVILAGLFGDLSGEDFDCLVVGALGLYSLAGLFFARWLFFRAQDVQWSGGTIVMPEMRGLPAWFSRSSVKRMFRPHAALWRKEIQLHQSQFVMAGALLLLHLGVLATRTFANFGKNSTTGFILEVFWGLWLVMPVLVGCAAVAEERKLGTLEGQLCLPVRRRTQFAIKFSVALFLSVLLGAVMPLLLEGSRILPDNLFTIGSLAAGWQNHLSATQLFLVHCLGIFMGLLPLLTLFGIAAAFGVISFYVSSLMRNTLQTLAPSVLGIGLGFFGMFVIAQMQTFDLDFLWRGPLPYFIGVPVLLLALPALAFWNFQHIRTGWKMWRRNFLGLALALAFAGTATSAVYHRAWEKLTPFEPPHGAARLSQSNPASLSTQFDGISVRLPDGKIWLSYFRADQNNLNPISMLLGNFKITLADGKFINGSNWLTVQSSYRELIGIKTDGSLWVSEGPEPKGGFQNGKWTINEDKKRHLMPFGNETNWSSFVPAGLSALLVKNDGTLWRWGVTNDFYLYLKHQQWPGLRAFMPHRLGTESNWAEVFRYHNFIYLRKTDGSLWMWITANMNDGTVLEIEPGFTVQSVKNPGLDKFRSVARVSHGRQFEVGVRSDGTFHICADWDWRFEPAKGRHYGVYEWFPTDLPIGDGTNWLAVAGDGDKIVTLKDDGSLWLWDFHFNIHRAIRWNFDLLREIQDTRPVRLGTHSDWIAISGNGDVTALAADGSLWFWPLESAEVLGNNGMQFFYNGDSHFEPLLEISPKPQSLGNIFSGQH